MRFSIVSGFKNDKQTYCTLFMLSVYRSGYADTLMGTDYYLKIFTKWIHEYIVTVYPRIHLFLGVSLNWLGILQLSHFWRVKFY